MRYLLAALLLSACSQYIPTPLAGQARQDAYSAYVDTINQKLKDVWNPKRAFHDYQGLAVTAGKNTTVVFAKIDAEGNLITAGLRRGDVEFLGREAIRALARSSPFAPPPTGLLQRTLVDEKVAGALYTVIPLQFTIVVAGTPGSWIEARDIERDINDTSITPTELYLEL